MTAKGGLPDMTCVPRAARGLYTYTLTHLPFVHRALYTQHLTATVAAVQLQLHTVISTLYLINGRSRGHAANGADPPPQVLPSVISLRCATALKPVPLGTVQSPP